jgi:diguanylate cyclase (GGDEF)-like protein/PAS domain S-box-containing protein
MSNLYEGVYVVDKARKIIFWNNGSEIITGFSAQEVINSHCYMNILKHVDESGKRLCFEGCPLEDTLLTGRINEADVYLHHKKGHRIPVTVKSIPLFNENNEVIAAVEVFTDRRFLEEKQAENIALKQLLEKDNLTAIYNRNYMEFQLDSVIKEAEKFNTQFSLLFIDIDHFKDVNDTYGHNIGDEVIKMIANTLMNNLRPKDIAGRWGGEEFLVLLKNVGEIGLEKIADRLRMLCQSSSLDTNGKKVSVTVSIGATYYRKGDSTKNIVERADQLMYASKEAGRNRVTIK